MNILGYKEGMEYFHKKEYAHAVRCFENGTSFGGSSNCVLMLGKCYEHGLGVPQDLVVAKDYYKVALLQFNDSKDDIHWLQAKLEELKNIPDLNEQRKSIEGVGPVIVKRAIIPAPPYRSRGDRVPQYPHARLVLMRGPCPGK